MGPMRLTHVPLRGPCGVYCGGTHRRCRNAGQGDRAELAKPPVMEPKIDELTRHIEKYNCLIEHIYKLEQDVAVVRRNADTLEEKSDR